MTNLVGPPADPAVELNVAADAEDVRARHENKHLRLMLILAFGTGMIDAIGYLGLDRVFTGNMTGNVVILGMALAGSDDLPILGPFLALLGFMLGAAIAGRTLPAKTAIWIPRFSWMLSANAALMIVCGVGLLLLGERPAAAEAAMITTALAIAMGLQAGLARVIAVRDVTTVVVTSTITSLAADSVLGANRRAGAPRRVMSILVITVGAFVGALLVHWHLSAGLFVSAAIAAAVALLGLWPRSADTKATGRRQRSA